MTIPGGAKRAVQQAQIG